VNNLKVKYTGNDPVLLMHKGQVWRVNKGDEVELDEVPNLPHFEEVKISQPKMKGDDK